MKQSDFIGFLALATELQNRAGGGCQVSLTLTPCGSTGVEIKWGHSEEQIGRHFLPSSDRYSGDICTTLKISRTTLYRYVRLADATPADPGNSTD